MKVEVIVQGSPPSLIASPHGLCGRKATLEEEHNYYVSPSDRQPHFLQSLSCPRVGDVGERHGKFQDQFATYIPELFFLLFLCMPAAVIMHSAWAFLGGINLHTTIQTRFNKSLSVSV